MGGVAVVAKVFVECGPLFAQSVCETLIEGIVGGDSVGDGLCFGFEDIAANFVNHGVIPFLLCFSRFCALDAAGCIRDGFEALGSDGIATIVADAVGSVVDTLECLLDQSEFLMRLIFESSEDFAVFEFDGLFFKVRAECAVFLAQIALDLLKAVAQGLCFGFELGAKGWVVRHLASSGDVALGWEFGGV